MEVGRVVLVEFSAWDDWEGARGWWDERLTVESVSGDQLEAVTDKKVVWTFVRQLDGAWETSAGDQHGIILHARPPLHLDATT